MRIEYRPPIDTAHKDIDIFTGEAYDPSNPQHISEWAYAVGFSYFKIGEEITDDILGPKVMAARILQAWLTLVDKGEIIMSWDPENEEIIFEGKRTTN